MTDDEVLRAQIDTLLAEMATYAQRVDKRIAAIEAKYSPDQPRDDQGRWTDTGGSTSGGVRDAPRRVADAVPDSQDAPATSIFKTDTAIQSLHKNISPKIWGNGECAANVANAIRATGIRLGRPDTRPNAKKPWARDYGPTLEAVEFSQIAKNSPSGKYPPPGYTPQRGDVVVIQPIPGQDPAGHMAMYDGKRWVSDFRQERGIWSNRHYEHHGADYKIYRHPNSTGY